MTDEASAQAGASICPWCSAALPAPVPDACPGCGARLVAEGESLVPGVTAIDAEAVLRSARSPTRSRGGLLSWLGGGEGDLGPPPPPGALEPPSAAVLEEMRRLAFEAELANLEAEAREIEAEQAVAGLPAVDEALADTGGDDEEATAEIGDEAAPPAAGAADESGPDDTAGPSEADPETDRPG